MSDRANAEAADVFRSVMIANGTWEPGRLTCGHRDHSFSGAPVASITLTDGRTACSEQCAQRLERGAQ